MNMEKSVYDNQSPTKCKLCNLERNVETIIYSIKHPFYICYQCIQNILNTDGTPDDKVIVNRNIKPEE